MDGNSVFALIGGFIFAIIVGLIWVAVACFGVIPALTTAFTSISVGGPERYVTRPRTKRFLEVCACLNRLSSYCLATLYRNEL